jgi:hypothetical protein
MKEREKERRISEDNLSHAGLGEAPVQYLNSGTNCSGVASTIARGPDVAFRSLLVWHDCKGLRTRGKSLQRSAELILATAP